MSKGKVVLASERHGSRPKAAVDTEEEVRDLIANDRSLSDGSKMKLVQIAKNMVDEWKKHMAEPGALGLPKLLESRRLEYGIVDNAFAQEAVYDRLYVWQIPRVSGETYEGTSILRPDSGHDRERHQTPRGILVSAGMRALDNLRSNGIDLGHIVNFIRSSPWRMPIGSINGVEIPPLMVMRDGDLVSSEDLASARRKGDVTTAAVEVNGGIEHRLQNKDGTSTAVGMPWMSDDY